MCIAWVVPRTLSTDSMKVKTASSGMPHYPPIPFQAGGGAPRSLKVLSVGSRVTFSVLGWLPSFLCQKEAFLGPLCNSRARLKSCRTCQIFAEMLRGFLFSTITWHLFSIPCPLLNDYDGQQGAVPLLKGFLNDPLVNMDSAKSLQFE